MEQERAAEPAPGNAPDAVGKAMKQIAEMHLYRPGFLGNWKDIDMLCTMFNVRSDFLLELCHRIVLAHDKEKKRAVL